MGSLRGHVPIERRRGSADRRGNAHRRARRVGNAMGDQRLALGARVGRRARARPRAVVRRARRLDAPSADQSDRRRGPAVRRDRRVLDRRRRRPRLLRGDRRARVPGRGRGVRPWPGSSGRRRGCSPVRTRSSCSGDCPDARGPGHLARGRRDHHRERAPLADPHAGGRARSPPDDRALERPGHRPRRAGGPADVAGAARRRRRVRARARRVPAREAAPRGRPHRWDHVPAAGGRRPVAPRPLPPAARDRARLRLRVCGHGLGRADRVGARRGGRPARPCSRCTR